MPGLDVRVVAGEPDAAVTGGGLTVGLPHDLAAIRAAELVIVPNWRSGTEDPPAPVLESLRVAPANGARIRQRGPVIADALRGSTQVH